MSRVLSSTRIVPIVLLLLGSAHPALSQGFQGSVTYKTQHDNGSPETMMETTSGNKARFDMQGKGHVAFIVNNDARTWTMIDGEKKTYTVITEEQAKQFRDAAAMYAAASVGHIRGAKEPSTEPQSKISVVKTGRTETVAGVSCDVWAGAGQDAEGKVKKGEVCIAKGVGFNPAALLSGPLALMGGGRSKGGMPPGMEGLEDALKGGGGILKFTSIEDNGQRKVEMEATQIQPGNPGDAAFNPPPGYTEQKMPDMKQLMSAPGLKH